MNGENIGRGLLAEVCDRQLFRTTSHRFRPQRSDTTTTRESESRLKWWFPIILCSVTMFLVPLRSLFRSSCSSLCVVSFIHWLSFFGVWSVCHTDTHIYLLSLALALSIHNKQIKSVPSEFPVQLDRVPITSTTHTHVSHSSTSRLLNSSLTFGVPVPRGTQCM